MQFLIALIVFDPLSIDQLSLKQLFVDTKKNGGRSAILWLTYWLINNISFSSAGRVNKLIGPHMAANSSLPKSGVDASLPLFQWDLLSII